MLVGDVRKALRTLPEKSIQTCVTSPPYWGLRDYGTPGQLGLEPTPEEYVANMVEVFREVWRVLRKDGTLWLNLGDSYANANPGSLKPKDLCGIPWRVAFALQADGWYLRSDIIWNKSNPMPESVTDRPTKAHEYIFLLSKSKRYFYDAEAIREPAKWERWGNQTENKKHPGTAGHLGGKSLSELPISDKKNRRTVWTVATKPFPGSHFATFPPKLIEPCILAGTSPRACEVCGSPWERVVEKERTLESGSGKSGKVPVGKNGPRLQGGGETLDIRMGPRVKSITTGWQPTCTCQNKGQAACTVLDPFGGSGTVTMMAEKLGRNSVYIDLNPEYLEMAKERCGFGGKLIDTATYEIREGG